MYQSRSDVVARALEISVTNESTADVVITGAEVLSAQFTETAVWHKKDSTTVRAGRTVDLPVALPDPACAIADPRPIVRLTFSAPDDDEPIVAEVTPTDERKRLPELRAEECFIITVESVADLRADTLPRTLTAAGQTAAQLDISVVPDVTAEGGTIIVDSVAGTTLFTVIDPLTGATQTSFPIGARLPRPGGAPVTITLVPNRCDPHAVAEDKRGTLFPLTITAPDPSSATGTATGEFYVAAEPAVKESLIDFIAAACRFG